MLLILHINMYPNRYNPLKIYKRIEDDNQKRGVKNIRSTTEE